MENITTTIVFEHTINFNNNLLLLKLSTQCQNLLNAIETKQLGWKQRTKQLNLKQRKKRLGLKQRKMTRLLCMHIDEDITSGVLLQKKITENVPFMEPHLLGMITSVLGT